jgi:hypothetical protein
MKKAAAALLLLATILCGLVPSTKARISGGVHRRDQDEVEDEEIPVLIGFRYQYAERIIEKMASRLGSRFKNINAISASFSRSNLKLLEMIPGIEYIEEDGMVYPDGEAELYGLDLVQAESPLISSVPVTAVSACSDPDSFKVGVSSFKNSSKSRLVSIVSHTHFFCGRQIIDSGLAV